MIVPFVSLVSFFLPSPFYALACLREYTPPGFVLVFFAEFFFFSALEGFAFLVYFTIPRAFCLSRCFSFSAGFSTSLAISHFFTFLPIGY